MRNRKTNFLKIFCVFSLVLLMMFSLTGCKKKNAQKPSETNNKEKIENTETADSSPKVTSETSGLYAHGSVVVSKAGVQTEYKFDADGNMIDKNGNIFMKSEDVRQFTAAEEITFDKAQAAITLLGTKVAGSDELALREKVVEIVIEVKPEDSVNNSLVFTSKDESIVRFDEDKNPGVVKTAEEAEEEPQPSKIRIMPSEDGKIHLYATVSYSGYCNIKVENVLGIELDTITLNIQAKEGTPEELAAEEAKQAESADKNKNANGSGTTNSSGTNKQNTNSSSSTSNNNSNTGNKNTGTNGNQNSASQTSAADGHTHKFVEKVIEPTVRTQGYTLFTCEICGYNYRSNYTPKTAHTHDYENTVVPATYTTRGYTRHTCKICGQSYTDSETPILTCKHEKTTDTVKKPTCTEDGYTEHVCQSCKKSWRDTPTKATGHNMVVDTAKSKDATCKEDGVKVSKCSNEGCTVTLEEKVPKLTAHKWDEGKVTTAATCSANGTKTYTCSVCKDTKTETIPMTGEHKLSTKNAKAATCTEKGYSGDKVCSECGKTIERGKEIPAKGHSLTTINKKAATCKEAGYEGDQYCSVCKQTVSKGKVIPVSGTHSFDAGKVTKAATCKEAGVKTFTCSVCGKTKTESIPKLNHNLVTRNEKPATCTEAGNTGDKYCTLCNQKIESGKSIPAKGHNISVINKKTATCKETGYTGDEYCNVCKQTVKYGSVIPVTNNHSYDAGRITSPATCTNTGVKTFTCSVCGATRTEVVPLAAHKLETRYASEASCTEAGYSGDKYCTVCNQLIEAGHAIAANGHSYNSGEVTTPATCTSEGIKTFTCTKCNATRTEPVEKLAHSTQLQGQQDATCTETGYSGDQVCTVCGQTIQEGSVIQALGHAYGNPVVQPASCTEPGSETKTCSRCGESTTNEIPPNGHSPMTINASAATCTEPGYTGDSVCSVCNTPLNIGQAIPALNHSYNAVEDTEDPDYVAGYTLMRCERGDDQYWEDNETHETFTEKPIPNG